VRVCVFWGMRPYASSQAPLFPTCTHSTHRNTHCYTHSCSLLLCSLQAPQRAWLLSFLAHMDAALPHASGQAVANTLWAAGRLQLTMLPSTWLGSVLGRLEVLLPHTSSRELGVILAALAELAHRPNSKWMARWVGPQWARGYRIHCDGALHDGLHEGGGILLC
jgi:hypothetical protein